MSGLETIGLGVITNLISDGIKKIKFPKKKSESKKISERLQHILKLMNEERDEKFTIAEFSKILKLKKVSDLEKYFLNHEEPTFKFLKKFSNEFAINIRWITEGKEHPFKYDEDHYIKLYDDCLKRIEKTNPEIIYFVRADTVEGETCILLEVNNHRSIVLNTFVHFSAQNGHGGTRELVDLRKLIMTLILEKNYITKGLIVSKRIFDELYEGKIHSITALQRKKGSFQHWHDDFTDIHNERYGYQHHQKYDQNFKDAFNIVKNYIEINGEI